MGPLLLLAMGAIGALTVNNTISQNQNPGVDPGLASQINDLQDQIDSLTEDLNNRKDGANDPYNDPAFDPQQLYVQHQRLTQEIECGCTGINDMPMDHPNSEVPTDGSNPGEPTPVNLDDQGLPGTGSESQKVADAQDAQNSANEITQVIPDTATV